MDIRLYNAILRRIASGLTSHLGFTPEADRLRAKWLRQLRQDYPYHKMREEYE